MKPIVLLGNVLRIRLNGWWRFHAMNLLCPAKPTFQSLLNQLILDLSGDAADFFLGHINE